MALVTDPAPPGTPTTLDPPPERVDPTPPPVLAPPGSGPTATGPMTSEQFLALEQAHDSRRYELLDGVFVVSPSPTWPHQDVAARIYDDLRPELPDGLALFFAPLDVRLDDLSVVEPDVFVVRRPTDRGQGHITDLPLLAVEVLSPSTRRYDVLLKKERYERAGIASYWVVDPDALRLTVWELGPDGRYAEVADTTGPVSLDRPYPVTLDPATWG